jgi:hypothetical protein
MKPLRIKQGKLIIWTNLWQMLVADAFIVARDVIYFKRV